MPTVDYGMLIRWPKREVEITYWFFTILESRGNEFERSEEARERAPLFVRRDNVEEDIPAIVKKVSETFGKVERLDTRILSYLRLSATYSVDNNSKRNSWKRSDRKLPCRKRNRFGAVWAAASNCRPIRAHCRRYIDESNWRRPIRRGKTTAREFASVWLVTCDLEFGERMITYARVAINDFWMCSY